MSEEGEEAEDTKLPTTDTEERGDESEDGARQTDLEEGVEPDRQWRSRDWQSVMEGSEGLAYDDLWSDSDAMMTGVECLQGTMSLPPTWGPVTPHMPGSPMDRFLPMEAMEVHVNEVGLEGL